MVIIVLVWVWFIYLNGKIVWRMVFIEGLGVLVRVIWVFNLLIIWRLDNCVNLDSLSKWGIFIGVNFVVLMVVKF